MDKTWKYRSEKDIGDVEVGIKVEVEVEVHVGNGVNIRIDRKVVIAILGVRIGEELGAEKIEKEVIQE